MSIPSTTVYFRIAPVFRQCATYVLLGLPMVGIVLHCVWLFNQLPVPDGGFVLVVLALLGLPMLLPLRWALRVDERGVARRRLLGWDLWEWSDFASGRILKRAAELVDPERPWGGRVLQLAFLTPTDMKQLFSLINEAYRLPPAPEVTGTLTIQYRAMYAMVLDAGGIRLGKRFSVYEQPEVYRAYGWRDVQRVHLTRLEPLRRDFVHLEIAFPDDEVEFHRHLHGASREQVDEFLRRHVAPDRIEVDIFGERPARRIDVEKKLAKAIEERRGFRKMLWILGSLFAGLLLLEATDEPRKALARAVVYGGFFGPLLWKCERRLGQKIATIGDELAHYDDAQSSVHSEYAR